MAVLYFLFGYGVPAAVAFLVCHVFDLELAGWLATFGILVFGCNSGTKAWNRRTREYEYQGGSCLGMFIGMVCVAVAIVIYKFF
ncbi:hypothetical protein [Treponema sp. Marseille-Q4523]|uniref:hypothetical protein n=1 Tax=Treponema TaxID=157 RepID=UPI001961FF76|nr:hypothetical protein [Treponema sp. Marseille-Q4523]MBM7023942.1 hypothetical protein [Treponema sp. Marseille-Q4523]